MIAKWGATPPGGCSLTMFRVHFGVQVPLGDLYRAARSLVSHWEIKRRGRDSNPEAREGAGFRDRCIAVLPPLRGVLLVSGRVTRREAAHAARSGPLFLRLDGVRTGWDLNPRDTCMPTRFPGVRLKPLGHPSRSISKRRSRDSNPGGCFHPTP